MSESKLEKLEKLIEKYKVTLNKFKEALCWENPNDFREFNGYINKKKKENESGSKKNGDVNLNDLPIFVSKEPLRPSLLGSKRKRDSSQKELLYSHNFCNMKFNREMEN